MLTTQNQANTQKYREITDHALKAARIGREVLLHYFGRLKKVEEKFQAGLVSEADKTSEIEIAKYLKAQFPEFAFLGEESAPESLEAIRISKQPRWILDPLDGTTNYVHGLPMYAVSLGLEIDGQVVSAVIDAPGLNSVYCAWAGGGAYLNGNRLQVSKRQKLSEGLLATGFNSEIEEVLQRQISIFSEVVRKSHGIRRAGAAALDLAWVAAGVFDGYFEQGPKPWDIAAGWLLIQEAGGVLKNFKGEDYALFMNDVVAGNPTMVEQICQITRRH
jgi:myo-inositol-1(or 4)-monophosphatase